MMSQIGKSIGHHFAWMLALILALSCGGNASALAWVHADGSPCHICPAENARPAVDPCCAPTAPILTAPDCQSCCEARRTQAPFQHVLPTIGLAVLPRRAARIWPVEVRVEAFAFVQQTNGLAVFHDPPSLRGPPVCDRSI